METVGDKERKEEAGINNGGRQLEIRRGRRRLASIMEGDSWR